MRLRDFKRSHVGQRAFIVGNGPSLNDTPLEKLENTFAMNNIATIYDKRDWRPDYYYNVNHQVEKHSWWLENAERSIALGIPSFVRRSSPLSGDNVYRLRFEGRLKPIADKVCRIPEWSYDAEKCVTHYRMSAYSLAQLVMWMGFSPIYMVGMDVSFSMNPEECHFSDDYEGTFEWSPELVNHENYWHTVAHEWIRYYGNLYEVPIYNATVGGNLEVYPRVDIYDIC